MDKSLGTLLRFWGVFQFTQVQPLPSPHKQCWTRVSRIFSEIQLCIGWGEGEVHENFENDAVLRGSREMTEKYAYCSTVPRTFVQDCSSKSPAAHTQQKLTQVPPPPLPAPTLTGFINRLTRLLGNSNSNHI